MEWAGPDPGCSSRPLPHQPHLGLPYAGLPWEWGLYLGGRGGESSMGIGFRGTPPRVGKQTPGSTRPVSVRLLGTGGV